MSDEGILMKRIAIFIAIFLLMTTAVQAAEKIVNVDFSGQVSASETNMRSHVTSIEGTTYNEKNVEADIKNLYQTGLFTDVSVQKLGIAGGVKLIFQVVEKKTVGKLTIEGNKKIKKKDLLEAAR